MSILVLTSDTLIGTPATGNLEYNGQFFGTDSNASRAQMQRITQSTSITLTNQTAPEFTNIPSWVKKITIMFQGISTNSTGNPLVQLGTGATPTYTTSGYLGASGGGGNGSTIVAVNFTTGIGIVPVIAAASVIHGAITITNITGNNWVAFGSVAQSNNTNSYVIGSSVALGAALTAVRLYIDGTQFFDAGSINILYEG